MDQYIFQTLISLAITTVCGLTGYFLRRTMGTVDRHENEIASIKENFVTKNGFDKVERGIKDDLAKIEGAFGQRFDRIDAEIKGMKGEYINRDDYFRGQAEVKGELRRIMDILLEMKGEPNGKG